MFVYYLAFIQLTENTTCALVPEHSSQSSQNRIIWSKNKSVYQIRRCFFNIKNPFVPMFPEMCFCVGFSKRNLLVLLVLFLWPTFFQSYASWLNQLTLRKWALLARLMLATRLIRDILYPVEFMQFVGWDLNMESCNMLHNCQRIDCDFSSYGVN